MDMRRDVRLFTRRRRCEEHGDEAIQLAQRTRVGGLLRPFGLAMTAVWRFGRQ
jgi:hypothetical protein